jgi:hypothetical protein
MAQPRLQKDHLALYHYRQAAHKLFLAIDSVWGLEVVLVNVVVQLVAELCAVGEEGEEAGAFSAEYAHQHNYF